MANWIVLHLARFARERRTIEPLANKAGVRGGRNCALQFSNFELQQRPISPVSSRLPPGSPDTGTTR
jgi:hypothetical protein